MEKQLNEILIQLSEAHNLLAKSSLHIKEYMPISNILSEVKIELFNINNKTCKK